MKIVLVATRVPSGRITGRKVVLRTILRSCQALGHEVSIAVLAGTRARRDPAPEGIPTRWLPTPSLIRILWNLIRHFLLGRLTLNECLYFRPGSARELHEMIRAVGASVVIGDMIRVAPYLESSPVPWVIDLDDLLSARYGGLAERGAPVEMIVGYYRQYLPKALRRPAGVLARALLGIEARRMLRREVAVARGAGAVGLVSDAEARTLGERAGRHVHPLPMAVTIHDNMARHLGDRPASLAFLGNLDIQWNVDALRYYAAELVPRFRASGLTDRLTVIGFCPESIRRELGEAHFRFVGYVPDLGAELARHQIFAAPIVSGTGVKTKLLDAMVCALPVIGTPEAFQGLGITPGRNAIVAATPAEWVEARLLLEQDPDQAEKVGLAGREHVMTHFSEAVLQERWAAALAEASGAPAREAQADTIDGVPHG